MQYCKEFDSWLKSILVGKINEMHLRSNIVNWKNVAPHAKECHPREDHLVPLFVVAAAAGDEAEGKV
jgi:aromatic ring-opening dioxygenase catalytic subunit (LigB family)